MKRMNPTEFIALIAMMFATIAFSIDAMLPALPEIAAELSPETPNRAQLILVAFVLGMGIGTLFTGPLSDAFGRKRVIAVGSMIYVAASAVAWASSSLEVVLAARVIQGIGAAAPRVVALAILRDLYSGREMARMISIAMMIFTIFPAFAPLIGAGIIALTGWRGIFLAFILFSLICVTWMGLRLPEPLARENRRPFRIDTLAAALREVVFHPVVRLSITVQTLCFAMMFAMLTMVQPIYDLVFGQGDNFPYWFGAIALFAGSASVLNAAVVVRLGMRRIVAWSLVGQLLLSGGIAISTGLGLGNNIDFALFVIWQTSIFFMAGTTLGNLNAIALEPMGHIAGMAASISSAVATVGAALLAAPLGQIVGVSILPLALYVCLLAAVALSIMRLLLRPD